MLFADGSLETYGRGAETAGRAARGGGVVRLRRSRSTVARQLEVFSEVCFSSKAISMRVLTQLTSTVPVPVHWNAKRDYLAGKKGIEKQPYLLPCMSSLVSAVQHIDTHSLDRRHRHWRAEGRCESERSRSESAAKDTRACSAQDGQDRHRLSETARRFLPFPTEAKHEQVWRSASLISSRRRIILTVDTVTTRGKNSRRICGRKNLGS